MFSTMVEIILGIEFQCLYDFYLNYKVFLEFSFYCNLNFREVRENKVVSMKLRKINIRFEIH